MTQILIEEYKIANQAYNRLFEETLNILKFYTSIILVSFGVILLKNNDSEIPNYIQIYIYFILILLSFSAIAIQIQITKRRTTNIRRVNFLRQEIFKTKKGEILIKEYNDITRYKLTSKNFATSSIVIPIVFYLATVVFIILLIFNSR